MPDLPRVQLRHCPSCTCEAPQPDSPERARMKKIFRGVPDTGCLDYRGGQYCGKRVTANDRCAKHQKK